MTLMVYGLARILRVDLFFPQPRSQILRSRILVSSVLLSLVVLFLAANAKAESIYVSAASLVDPLNGELIRNPVVQIDDGRIVSVRRDGAIPADVKVFDLGDATILPGLADLHVHLSWYAMDNAFTWLTGSYTDEAIGNVFNAKTLLMAGFTAVRNQGPGGSREGTRNVRIRNCW